MNTPLFAGATQPPITTRIKSILNHRSPADHTPIMKYTSLLLACLAIVLSATPSLQCPGHLPSTAAYPDLGQIYDLAQLDHKPAVTSQPRPQYPFEMRRGGIKGKVLVDFIVKPDGAVTNA